MIRSTVHSRAIVAGGSAGILLSLPGPLLFITLPHPLSFYGAWGVCGIALATLGIDRSRRRAATWGIAALVVSVLTVLALRAFTDLSRSAGDPWRIQDALLVYASLAGIPLAANAYAVLDARDGWVAVPRIALAALGMTAGLLCWEIVSPKPGYEGILLMFWVGALILTAAYFVREVVRALKQASAEESASPEPHTHSL